MSCKHAFSNSSSPQPPAKTMPVEKHVGVLNRPASTKTKKKIIFPSKARSGMTVAADHAWQKRGYDSLTGIFFKLFQHFYDANVDLVCNNNMYIFAIGHTFLISKRNKVLKTVIKHRSCATCKWWKRNRPGQRIRSHRCVWNHNGSARMMESEAGLLALKEMSSQGTPVEIIEGDGDNTLIARLKSQCGLSVVKRLDKNHCVKNIIKTLYDLRNSKVVKISNQIIQHLSKCIKYIFSKNQGDKEGMRENLVALVPHQFGDHSKCHGRFCGYKRKPNETYVHRSLPYKVPLQDPLLRQSLDHIFAPIIAKSASYIELGSSQACEHANRETCLRVPKHLHYGESESLDFRVKATAAFINEGRKYLSEVK